MISATLSQTFYQYVLLDADSGRVIFASCLLFPSYQSAYDCGMESRIGFLDLFSVVNVVVKELYTVVLKND